MNTLTEGTTPGDWLLTEADDRYSRDYVTIAAGADLASGTVLGQITASGEYAPAGNGAADGTETAVAVLLNDAKAATAAVKAVVIARHARVRRGGLTFDASHDTEAKRSAAMQQLKVAGIIED
ncbi:MAG: head decoration protein [Pseudomonadota bacterium]